MRKPTAKEAQAALIGKPWRDWIIYAVKHWSRGVYEFIQRNYNNPLPNWQRGFEQSTLNSKMMIEFLENKAMSYPSGIAQFLVDLYKGINY